jgi:hypothetical protein
MCRKLMLLLEAHLFVGEARPPSEEGPEAIEAGAKPPTSGVSTEVQPCKRIRRSKGFWEKERCTPSEVHNFRSERQTPPGGARGKDAVHGWVAACLSCTLGLVAKSGCLHGEEGRVECPAMLLGTGAVQLTKPKLRRLSDATNFHDPWVTSLDKAPPLESAS